MKRLTQQDYAKIKEAFSIYSNLNPKDKANTDKILTAKLDEIYSEIAARCEKDWAWNLLHEHFNNPQKIRTFNLNHYSERAFWNYGIKFTDFEKTEKEHNQKLRHIDNQRFTLGKKIQFNLEQKKLDNIEKQLLEGDAFWHIHAASVLMNKVRGKNLNKAERQIRATRLMQESFDNTTNYITNEVLHESVKQNPYLTVADLHTPDLVIKQKTATGKTVWIDTAYLKTVLSNIKTQALGIDQEVDIPQINRRVIDDEKTYSR